jgi:sulfur carrier protein ThiS
MVVTARLFGTLHRFASPGSAGVWQADMPAGSTLRDVLCAIGAEEREMSVAALNGIPIPLDTVIPPEADLVLVTLMGGG